MASIRIGLYYKKELIAEFVNGENVVHFMESSALAAKLAFYEVRFGDIENPLPERIPTNESMIER